MFRLVTSSDNGVYLDRQKVCAVEVMDRYATAICVQIEMDEREVKACARTRQGSWPRFSGFWFSFLFFSHPPALVLLTSYG